MSDDFDDDDYEEMEEEFEETLPEFCPVLSTISSLVVYEAAVTRMEEFFNIKELALQKSGCSPVFMVTKMSGMMNSKDVAYQLVFLFSRILDYYKACQDQSALASTLDIFAGVEYFYDRYETLDTFHNIVRKAKKVQNLEIEFEDVKKVDKLSKAYNTLRKEAVKNLAFGSMMLRSQLESDGYGDK